MFSTQSYRFDFQGHAVGLHGDARAERLFHEHKKLLLAARNFVIAHSSMMLLGDDPLVDHLLTSNGFDTTDAAVVRIGLAGRSITAIAIPTRLWRDPEAKARFFEVKQQAGLDRTCVLLVPQRWLKASVRGSVARSIAFASRTRITRKQHAEVLDHLGKNKVSTIVETASAITGHSDPLSVVLAMSATGHVHIDRTSVLRGTTVVWLPADIRPSAEFTR
ncbi:hypothetical protein [Devosia aurantiaca]|uniref:Uncharacterized protein n=1 Tax=Devosia aurantiaca TaxID=2714858 RepID=A0A6M1SML6_9HYPH|nr:hypothetical protein [Devosia aurantiaca]NGP16535.1 hypothetical protein [Devosia aurantiaca]